MNNLRHSNTMSWWKAMESVALPRVDWADPKHLEILAKAVSPEGPGPAGCFIPANCVRNCARKMEGFPMDFQCGNMVLQRLCLLANPQTMSAFLRCLNMFCWSKVLSWVRILLLEISRCNCGRAGGGHSAIVSRILRPAIGRKGTSEDACPHWDLEFSSKMEALQV